MAQIKDAPPVATLPGQTAILMQYQHDGVRMSKSFNDRTLLADEMGLGKTVQVLYRIAKLLQTHPEGIFVVVAPACAKYVWKNQAKQHFGIRTFVCEGRKPPEMVQTRARVFIINYDILPGWVEFFRQAGIVLTAFDECHYLRNHTSRRTKAAARLQEDVPRVIGISGTPLMNRPIELFTVLNFLQPGVFSSRLSFGMEYSHAKRERGTWTFKGAQNLPQLNRLLLDTCMIRRRKKDVLTQLPEKQRFLVEMPMEDMKEYQEASNNFMFWLRSRKPSSVKGAERNEALVKIGYLVRLASKYKFNYLCEWIDNFIETSEGKLVVFTGRKALIRALEARYGDIAVKVDGDVPVPQRSILSEAFNKDKRIRLFLGNYVAAGVAIDLTGAEDLLAADLPWTPGELAQAEDRIHRMNSKGNARIHLSVATGTIETSIARILTEKMEILSAVLDGHGNGDDLNVFDSLVDTLAEHRKCRK